MSESRRGWFRSKVGEGAGSRRLGRRDRAGAEFAWWRRALLRPQAAAFAGVALAFAASAGLLVGWARERYVPVAGRVLDETRLVRSDFSVRDAQATERARDAARQRTPRVYVADEALFEALASSIEQAPATLADADTTDKVAPEIRTRFGLDDRLLAALRARGSDESLAAEWRGAVRELMDSLSTTPLLSGETIQREQQTPTSVIELRRADRAPTRTHVSRAINLSGDRVRDDVARLVRRAGFGADVAPAVTERVLIDAKATFVLHEGETQRLAEDAAAGVRPVTVEHKAGETLARRGEIFTDARRETALQERDAHARLRPASEAWGRRLGALTAAALVTLGMAGYLVVFSPWGRGGVRGADRTMARVAAGAGLALATTAVSCVGAVYNPGQVALLVTAPTVFLAMAVSIGLGRRAALALAGLQGLLPIFALGGSATLALSALAGVGVAAGALREVRNRRSLILAGVLAGVAMALGALAAGLFDRPPRAWTRDLPLDVAWALGAGPLVSFFALGMLPLIERVFGVATGMTLIELRDPKQPLLRELAQRAPGTYTHSLTVATLAEAAADEIGADGLHVYVGALYHDIGKMLKPDYFVENQAGGFSRHEKLSPAMSLLVIVGHVKDGLEMAREHALPRSLMHYIESHHGTTLVEYFYNRAKDRAGDDEDIQPQEFGYRYPGPKPQTREAAILMLCDAVESASRALAEPNPSRIESLVGAIAGMRLTDGQFDECGITLRELHAVERSVVKSLNSIYHARIAYRSTAEAGDARRPRTGSAGA